MELDISLLKKTVEEKGYCAISISSFVKDLDHPSLKKFEYELESS